MRILTFTTLYPNSVQTHNGLFVEERLTHLLHEIPDYQARVIAPVPWFPFKSNVFGRYAGLASVPARETRNGIDVSHPKYPVIPKIGMAVAPYLLASFAEPALKKLLRTGWDFELIDSHYFYPDGVAAAILGRRLRKPVSITARGSDINVIARYSTPRRLMIWAAGECSRVITVSRALKTEIEALGVDPQKIVALRNGVDLEKFEPRSRTIARQRLDISPQCRVLVSVGNLLELKGHHLVIRALRYLDDAPILLIVGEGEMRGRLYKLCKELGLENRVRFTGSVPQDELSWYYSAADVFVLASSREGMPNVVLESLACGTPVVSTDVGGVSEIVKSDVAGELVRERAPRAIARAVDVVLSKPRSREEVREYAEQFSWNMTSIGQRDVFENAVERFRN